MEKSFADGKKLFRRKNYFVQKPFQLKFAIAVFLGMCTIILLVTYRIYIFNWKLISRFFLEKAIYVNLLSVFQYANFCLVGQLIFLAFLIAIASIFVSHKIAGPVYRLEHNLRAMAKGDLTLVSKLRKNDEFQSLADSLEELTKKLNEEFRNNRELLEKISSSSNLDEIKRLVEKLKAANSNFKLRA